jgi:hypothetical protein
VIWYFIRLKLELRKTFFFHFFKYKLWDYQLKKIFFVNIVDWYKEYIFVIRENYLNSMIFECDNILFLKRKKERVKKS